MSIFLDLSQRGKAALDVFDPLEDEWLFRLLDPRDGPPTARGTYWLRMAALVSVLFLPEWIFSALPSVTSGGQVFGRGSISADVGLMGIVFFTLCALALLPLARRVIGVLLSDLVQEGIASPELRSFTLASRRRRGLLKPLTPLSSVAGKWGAIWVFGLVVEQFLVYLLILGDGTASWQSSPASPGSPLFFMAIGDRQPNLAGLWAFLVRGPLVLYLLVLVARILVAFASACDDLAQDAELRVTPSHPDGVGGLLSVGQVALFLSLFTFVLGIDLAAITAGEMVLARSAGAGGMTGNLELQVVLWVAYLALGSLLFFLPLLPLREKMARAKRAYILEARALRREAYLRHEHHVAAREFVPDALQGLSALDSLITAAMKMAVWPLDRETLFRYAGLLLSPLAPLAFDQLPRALAWFKDYIGLAP